MSESVFSKELKVRLKGSDHDDRLARLQVSVTIQASSDPMQKRCLHLQLTDQSDYFFLYSLRLDEDDFQSLKMEQGLLVDYPLFPQKLNDLLSLCAEEECKEMPKFILQLIMADTYALLNVVETNPFKHLIHLSLRVLPGNDTAIKSFLAECLREYKLKTERLEKSLQSTSGSLTSSLNSVQQTLAAREAELTKLKMDWESRLTEQNAKNAQMMNEEKQMALQNQAATQQRYQLEKRDLEQAHMKIVKQLEARIYELDTQNKELTETKFVNDASIRDLTSKLKISEEECKGLRENVQQLRKDNSVVDSELHKQEKTVSQLHTQIAVLEQRLSDKQALHGKSTELLQSEQKQKQLLEEEITNAKTSIKQLEGTVKTLSDEILKANEIIRKLQQDTKTTVSKLKLRSQIALKQEEALKEKETELEKLGKEREQLLTNMTSTNTKLANLEEKLSSTEKTLEEAQKKNASNENVISWLNKQLDQVQSGKIRFSNSMEPSTHRTSVNNATARNNSAPSLQLESSPALCESKLPQPMFKSTPISAAETEIQQNKENGPAIDAMYLPKSTAMPLRPANQIRSTQMLPVKTRISKDIVQNQQGLVTSYFPQQK